MSPPPRYSSTTQLCRVSFCWSSLAPFVNNSSGLSTSNETKGEIERCCCCRCCCCCVFCWPFRFPVDCGGMSSDAAAVLYWICAVLYIGLALAALWRLVQKYQQEPFPFELLCLAACRRCVSRSSEVDDDSSSLPNTGNPRSSVNNNSITQSLRQPLFMSNNASMLTSSTVRKLRIGYLVIGSLLAYATLRSVQLVLFASGSVDITQDLNTRLYTFVPAVAFMVLQTSLLTKWVDHVSEITHVLQNHKFRLGSFLISCSVLFACSDIVVTALTIVDIKVYHFSRQPDKFWNILQAMLCGTVYMFNGLSFSGLGMLLRSLWKSNEPTDNSSPPRGASTSSASSAVVRILAIALTFGAMCFVRGGILLLFMDDDDSAANGSGGPHEHGNGGATLRNVTHSDWGAQSVLAVEWLCVVISLLLLSTKSSTTASGATVSANALDGSAGNGTQQRLSALLATPRAGRSFGSTIGRGFSNV